MESKHKDYQIRLSAITEPENMLPTHLYIASGKAQDLYPLLEDIIARKYGTDANYHALKSVRWVAEFQVCEKGDVFTMPIPNQR